MSRQPVEIKSAIGEIDLDALAKQGEVVEVYDLAGYIVEVADLEGLTGVLIYIDGTTIEDYKTAQAE